MNNPSHSSAYGAFLLRVALGVMWVSHSIVLKVMTFTMAGFTAFMVSQGLPAFLAYPVMLAEALGGILIIAGFYGRWMSLALLPILLGAFYIHAGNGWVFTATNGGWEYPLFLIIASIAHFLIGDGAFAIRQENCAANTANIKPSAQYC
jgi:putative oxidoreductase